MSIIPYSAIFIDLTSAEYFKLLAEFCKPHDRFKLQKMLEEVFIAKPETEKLLPCLSVRTAFDLYFQAADLPKGSEVIMTGVNIPDMVSVIRHHGLVPVPVNIDVDKLAPSIEEIERSINPKTKAIMLSYIFGATFHLDEIVKVAKKHNLCIIEDLAETFTTTEYNGHPDADISLFSFGTIKYNTALSGALTVVRNNDVLYRKMRYILEKYPIQPVSTYFKKCLKVYLPILALNNKSWNKGIRYTSNLINLDYKEYTVSLVRGFPKEGDFLEKFRYQVCTPLLANLTMKMKTFNNQEFQRVIKRIKAGQDLLVNGGVIVPGHQADIRSFWLFPIVVPDVNACYRLLNLRGVDAYLGATQLKVVESPHGAKFDDTDKTSEFFNQILYLPIHKNVPAKDIEKICKETIDVVRIVKNMKNKEKPKL